MSGAAGPRRRRRRRHDTTRKEKTLSATVAATTARAHARNDLKISTTLTYYAASSRRGAASSSLHDTRCAGASPPSADHPPHPPVRLRRPHEGARDGGRDARELRARHLVRSATLRRSAKPLRAPRRSIWRALARLCRIGAARVWCAPGRLLQQRRFRVSASASAAPASAPARAAGLAPAPAPAPAPARAPQCCACPSSRRGGPRTGEKKDI